MKKFLLLCILLAPNVEAFTQPVDVGENIFQLNPDYKLSPFTGMTRKHWKDASLYILTGEIGDSKGAIRKSLF